MANNSYALQSWIDASYGVHTDMRNHTGATITMGEGTNYSTSIQQKLNTKSSSERELVGVNDVMLQILWTQYFLEAQGYYIMDLTIY
jgi:hypothetical protein